MIVVDTGVLYSAFDTSDTDHARCAELLTSTAEELVISPLVVAEIDYLTLVRLGVDAEMEFLGELGTSYTVAAWGGEDTTKAVAVVRQYRDVRMGLTDAANVVLAARCNTTQLMALDQHYREITPLGGGEAFTLLPDDLSAPE